MTNPTTTTPTPQTSPKPFPNDATLPEGENAGQQADADNSPSRRPKDDDATIEDGAPDGVEIGEPIPEEKRTVRATAGEEQLEDEEQTGVDPDPDPSTGRH